MDDSVSNPDLARAAAIGLLLAFVAMIAGATIWATAGGQDGSTPGTARHAWERGLLMAAIVLTVLGLLLLAWSLRGSPGFGLVLAGATVSAIAGALGLVEEASTVSPSFAAAGWVLTTYVFLAFAGQGIVGFGLVQFGGRLTAAGWILVAWNIAWPLIVLTFSGDDLYYPVLHHFVLPAVSIPLLTVN
ncbi:MAG: hypothetical protein R3249_04070 [Nitriliruptorales bacterium]|nr:hypothetical protein [Nitriliruptorales bacterium]